VPVQSALSQMTVLSHRNWGGAVSDAAQDDSSASTHNGISDYRKHGCKITEADPIANSNN
jgi:hypothetical protein